MAADRYRPGLGELMLWDEVPARIRPGALLLGNGASRAIWDDFKYDSLFETAARDVVRPLSAAALRLFSSFETTNFERVLNALTLAKLVNQSLGVPSASSVGQAYDDVRESLIHAVHAVHAPWTIVSDAVVLPTVRNYLRTHSFVFTTNYDLLVYWAMMSHGEGEGFRDFFWINPFDITKIFMDEDRTNVLFLHGALHLYKEVSGAAAKRQWRPGENLLDTFSESFEGDRTPLFVSEGRWQEKVESIRESDYLSFALRTLSDFKGPLVVFGHSLTEEFDNHIVEALRPDMPRDIAVSVLPGPPESVAGVQSYLLDLLPKPRLWFFDSTSHPLGSRSLALSSRDPGR